MSALKANQRLIFEQALKLAQYGPVWKYTPDKRGIHLFSTCTEAIVTMNLSRSPMLGIDGVVPIGECFHGSLIVSVTILPNPEVTLKEFCFGWQSVPRCCFGNVLLKFCFALAVIFYLAAFGTG